MTYQVTCSIQQAMQWPQSYKNSCISPRLMDNYINMHIIDEPKSHLFLVHFSVLFLAIFEELIYRIMQKLTKLSFTGKEEERRKMQQ